MMMNDYKNVFYFPKADIWILKTDEDDYNPFASLGEVIFIGDFRPFQEQIDDLLDLLLLEDKYYESYIEILRRKME